MNQAPAPSKSEEVSSYSVSKVPRIPKHIYLVDGVPRCSKGRRKAVVIGITYPTSNRALPGCYNDALHILALLKNRYGFQDDEIRFLCDAPQANPVASFALATAERKSPASSSSFSNTTPDSVAANADIVFADSIVAVMPTRRNVVAALRWLATDTIRHDSRFLYYAGHGGSLEDTNNDEDDGKDECIICCDQRPILDDTLHTILVEPLAPGARLTAFFDCCHSGTMLDLPYVYDCKGEMTTRVDKLAPVRSAPRPRNFFGRLLGGPRSRTVDYPCVLMFGGCRDEELAAEISETESFDAALPRSRGGAVSRNLTEMQLTPLLLLLPPTSSASKSRNRGGVPRQWPEAGDSVYSDADADDDNDDNDDNDDAAGGSACRKNEQDRQQQSRPAVPKSSSQYADEDADEDGGAVEIESPLDGSLSSRAAAAAEADDKTETTVKAPTGGLFTLTFLNVIYENPLLSYAQILEKVYAAKDASIKQSPQLCTLIEGDHNKLFVI